jgi:hypothetical protein
LKIEDGLAAYVESITGGANFASGEIFAKILAENDNNSRHGIVIPKSSYGFFPDLPIPDPSRNERMTFSSTRVDSQRVQELSWIYYHRYPERRITRVGPELDNSAPGRRLVVFTKLKLATGTYLYYTDVAIERQHSRFAPLIKLLFGPAVTTPGAYVLLPLTASAFKIDDDLAELLNRFDEVRSLNWIDTLRTGDTGIGYTFETLVGVEENNHQIADFRGIEIKCKLRREAASPSGKINLFQLGPRWTIPGPNKSRLRLIGAPNADGRMACYSAVTPTSNNLGLALRPSHTEAEIDIFKNQDRIGFWEHSRLSTRLTEKHSRAVFVRAERREHGGTLQYRYTELLYCEQPDIDRFISLVHAGRIVFEFTMHLTAADTVRNHGYPWRLVDERDLEQLFAFQTKLRQTS